MLDPETRSSCGVGKVERVNGVFNQRQYIQRKESHQGRPKVTQMGDQEGC
jgi:hypothetical protein